MADVVGGSVVWNLDLNTKDFRKGLGSAKTQVSNATKAMQKRFKAAERGSKSLAKGLAGIGVGLVAIGVKSVEAFNIQARAEAELIQLHEENTGATKEQTQELFELASAQQAVGVIGDEAIISGQSQLATFKLSTDAIKSLTPAMADMVAKQKGVNATGDDFVNIGNLMGKVMEGNIGALGRYGVSFSEADEEIIKNGTETERAAKLAEVLAANYGGVNEALRDTFQGKMAAAKNILGDFSEKIGEAITDKIGPMIDAFNDWMEAMGGPEGLMKKFNDEIFPKFEEKLPIIIGFILGGLVPAFVALGTSIWTALAPLLPFLAIGAAIGFLVNLIVERMGGWRAAWETIQPIIVGVKDKLVELWERMQPVLKVIVDIAKNVWDAMLPAFQDLWDTIKNDLIPTLKEFWEEHGQEIIDTLKIVGAVLGVVAGIIIGIFIVAILSIIRAITKVITWFLRLQAFALRVSGKIADFFSGIGDAISEPFRKAFDKVKQFFLDALGFISDKSDSIRDSLQKINPFHRESPSLVDNVKAGVGVIEEEYKSLFDLQVPSAKESAAPAIGTGSTAVAGNTFIINIDGAFVRSRTELADLMIDGVEAANERLAGAGKPVIVRS